MKKIITLIICAVVCGILLVSCTGESKYIKRDGDIFIDENDIWYLKNEELFIDFRQDIFYSAADFERYALTGYYKADMEKAPWMMRKYSYVSFTDLFPGASGKLTVDRVVLNFNSSYMYCTKEGIDIIVHYMPETTKTNSITDLVSDKTEIYDSFEKAKNIENCLVSGKVGDVTVLYNIYESEIESVMFYCGDMFIKVSYYFKDGDNSKLENEKLLCISSLLFPEKSEMNSNLMKDIAKAISIKTEKYN